MYNWRYCIYRSALSEIIRILPQSTGRLVVQAGSGYRKARYRKNELTTQFCRRKADKTNPNKEMIEK